MKHKHRLGISIASVISIGVMTEAAAGEWPDSWSCTDNQCTGQYTSSGGGAFSVGIPFWNLAPSTDPFQGTTMEIGEMDNFEPNAENCDIDEQAVRASLGIKKAVDTDGIPNNTQNQTEYGAIIGEVGPEVQVGSIVQGQSYNQASPPSIDYTASWSSLRIPYAYTVGVIHYHPWHNESYVRQQNKRPSSDDWLQADGLVDQGGADSTRLTLYIVDYLGIVRAYPYVPPSQRTDTYPPPRAVSTACE